MLIRDRTVQPYLLQDGLLAEIINLLHHLLDAASVFPVHPVADPLGVWPGLPAFHHRDGGEDEVPGAGVNPLVLRAGELGLRRNSGGDGREGLDVALGGGHGAQVREV